MTKVIPVITARTRFNSILRPTRGRGERFIVDKRGAPQAVILSIEDYLASIVKLPKSLAALQRAAKGRSLDKMTSADIDREIRQIRKEPARGR